MIVSNILTEDQIEIGRHCLGLPNRYNRSYRNRYYTGEGNSAYDDWVKMVETGLAECEKVDCVIPKYTFFWLTKNGAMRCLKNDESLDPEDFE